MLLALDLDELEPGPPDPREEHPGRGQQYHPRLHPQG